MGVLGRQNTTSSRMTSATIGSLSSGARVSGSIERARDASLTTAQPGKQALSSRSEYTGARLNASAAGRPGGHLLLEPAQHLLPVGRGLSLCGRLRRRPLDPGPRAMDLALTAAILHAAGRHQCLLHLVADSGDRVRIHSRAQRLVEPCHHLLWQLGGCVTELIVHL